MLKVISKKDYIYAYLEATNYLCEEQHGSRAHRSCTTQLLLLSAILSKRIDSGLCTDIVYLDFQKAFDKVSHKRLLPKLKAAVSRGQHITSSKTIYNTTQI